MKLLDRRGDARRHTTLFEFDPLQYQHPVIEIFKGNPDAGLETTHIYEYFQTELPADPNTRLILNYDTNDPAIIEGSLGRGKVVLITTSLDRLWGTWAIWPSFPPMVNELVLYIATGKWGSREARVGQPLEIMTRENQLTLSPQMIAPDQEKYPLRSVLDSEDESRIITFPQTLLSGIYELDWGSAAMENTLYAVNVSSQESNLNHIGPQVIPPQYFRRPEGAQSQLAEVPEERSTQAGLAENLLLTVLALIVVEQLLLWRFSAGALTFLAVMLISGLSLFFLR